MANSKITIKSSEAEIAIYDELNLFIDKMLALSSSFPIAKKAIHDYHENIKIISKRFHLKHRKKISKNKYSIDEVFITQAQDLYKEISTSHIAEYEIVPESLFVSLVSVFDIYLGKLLRKIYVLKPELMTNSVKNMTFNEIVKYGTYEQVINNLIDKEIESLLRNNNHIDQFKTLESKFDIPLRKGLNSWSNFIELTERRNLFVHNDGIVSEYYILTLKENNIQIDKHIKVGYKLEVDEEYFKECYDCLFEIGIKLTYVLWNKLFSEQYLSIFHSLVEHTCFDLLSKKQYKMAQKLLQFALIPAFKKTDAMKKEAIIDLALAYKFDQNKEEAIKLLSDEDWSSVDTIFKLAIELINERFSEAEKLMIKLGKDITKEEYLNLPMFIEFRQLPNFKTAYYKIFGEEYIELSES